MRRWIFLLFAAVLTGCGEPSPQPDGERMLNYVREVVAHGQRTAGSDELARTREYIKSAISKAVEEQRFVAETPIGEVEFCNLQVVIPGKRNDRFVIISGHYDLKKLDPPMDGANDGGSSTAVLIELANLIENPPIQIRIVFFDGEECIGEKYTATDGLYGSRYYASGMDPEKCVCVINVDMVGGKELKFVLPEVIQPSMYKLFIRGAKDLGIAPEEIAEFIEGDILDDHTPFKERGIANIDLIGFNNPHWHTPEDTVDKLSPRSLELTAWLVLGMLRHLP